MYSDIVDKIIEYEAGTLDDKGIIDLFAKLVKTGGAWELQGAYSRMATNLINAGYIDKKGNVITYRQKTLEEC